MIFAKARNLSVLPADAPLRIEEAADGIRIHVPAGCQASLVERYDPEGPEPYTTQTKLHVTVAENARLTHYKLVHEGPQANHQSFLEVDVQKAASFESHVFLFEGAQIRNTIQVRMSGEDAECVLNGLYIGRGHQVIETHTLIEHQKPRGTSREFYKGILDDQSRGLFDGLILVQKEAQKTDSIQTNKNLLLSTEAHANANPELKILANDVKCKHGATIGQISADALFYLRSRGVPAPEARRLLIYAFASEMMEKVQLPEVRQALFPCLNLATSIKK